MLRTGRRRISVGGGSENDLVLRDGDIAKKHFVILVDGDDWRAQTYSPDERIVIDRRWAHPRTGKKGALVYAGGTEILLFVGDLDDVTIKKEIKARASDEQTVSGEREEATRIASLPVSDDETEMGTAIIGPDGRPVLVPPSSRLSVEPPRPLPSAPSLRASKPPPVAPSVRSQSGLPEPQTSRALVSQEPPSRKMKSASWERPRSSRRERSADDVPVVRAEPVSVVKRMPGADRSVFGSVRDKEAWGDRPSRPSMPGSDRSVVARPSDDNAWSGSANRSLVPARPSNAWGDRPQPSAAPPPRARQTNAWGDSASALEPVAAAPQPRNAWGDVDPAPNSELAASDPPSGGAISRVGLSKTADELRARGTDPALQLLREPDGDYATAMRLFGARIEELIRTFGYRAYLISSPEPLAGKTTCAVNLAFAMAEDPVRRVALIEADFRYPRIGDILGVPADQGLLSVLAGQMDVSDAIVKVADRNLIVFPAGGRHRNPAELLASPRFKTLMGELAETVDVAIVDAPSVRPFADTNLLLPLVDASFLVALGGVSTSGAMEQAMSQLGRERVVGAVYNSVSKAMLKSLKGDIKLRMSSLGDR